MSIIANIRHYFVVNSEKLQEYFGLVFFVGGFLFDLYTLGQRIALSDLYMVGLYLLGASVLLFILIWQRISMIRHQLATNHFFDPASFDFVNQPPDVAGAHPLLARLLHIKNWLYSDAPYYAAQFIWGSLFSALFILYIKSSGHWLALLVSLILGGLLFANEHMLHFYRRSMTLQWVVFTVTLMLWFNFLLPYWLGNVHASTFYLGTFVVLLLVGGLYYLYRKLLVCDYPLSAYGRIWPSAVVAIVLILLNILDVIPPVPLVRKQILLGTNLVQWSGQYELTVQTSPWWQFWQRDARTIYVDPSTRLYFAASIFAPPKLVSRITHQWQLLDPKSGTWNTVSQANFVMKGGRDAGFRGYSYKTAPKPGQWRIRIVSERQRTIEEVYFSLVDGAADPDLLQQKFLL